MGPILQQGKLSAAAWPLESVGVVLVAEVLVHPQTPHGGVEESASRLGVGALAALADAPPRVVELAAADLADAVEDALGAQRQGGADALFEDLGDGAREAEEDESGAPRSGGVRGFEDAGDVLVGEAGD